MLSADRDAADSGDGPRTGSVAGSAVASFLDTATQHSSVLLLEGEAGIGKTTHLLAALDQARDRGWQVLSTRPSEAESRLAYAALADLMREVDEPILEALPSPQRVAVDRVLSRAPVADTPTDPAATAAALLSVLDRLGGTGPVLLVVDDLHWVDPSSRQALGSVVRRLPTTVSLIGTVRTGEGGDPASWLQPQRPHSLRRVVVPRMERAEIETLLRQRIGSALTRVDLEHVHRVAGGNPFFALELARAVQDAGGASTPQLPDTLTEVVRSRVAGVTPEAQEALLAVASLAEPTVELVRDALGLSTEKVQALLLEAERRRLVEVDRRAVRFSHPLLAAGVYAEAGSAARRSMHLRLAGAVRDVEQRARHLALAATVTDPDTLQALDDAAATARIRGAPAAAAELLQLAIALGGEDHERRLRRAQHLVDAGEAERARGELSALRSRSPAGALRARTSCALALVHLDVGAFAEAAALLESALDETGTDRALRIEVLTRLAYACLNLGAFDDAGVHVEAAVRLGEEGAPDNVLSLALGMSVMVGFMRGDGVDEGRLTRALALEPPDAPFGAADRPHVQVALLRAWTGRLEEAAELLGTACRRSAELGQEHAVVFLEFQAALAAYWRGDVADLRALDESLTQHAEQLGGDLPTGISRTVSAVRAGLEGATDRARACGREGMECLARCGLGQTVATVGSSVLGFVEVSVGDHEAALAALDAQIGRQAAFPQATEIMMAMFVPDAVEALIGVGRTAEAEWLAAVLSDNGRRLDRPWMLATGARCRGLLHASYGDLTTALVELDEAMSAHARLPMPFETARTQLVLGQVHRRLRHKEAAASALTEALATFEGLGSSVWADRCRAELSRVAPGRRSPTLLTSSEQQVAELAAGGMTNREVAAALFISPKTVEANLAKVYRKLGIRSRAELGGLMAQQD